jgi:hypothetical protein
MAKAQKITLAEVLQRLAAIKLMVAATKGAMPTIANELRREACESIDDLVEDISR